MNDMIIRGERITGDDRYFVVFPMKNNNNLFTISVCRRPIIINNMAKFRTHIVSKRSLIEKYIDFYTLRVLFIF